MRRAAASERSSGLSLVARLGFAAFLAVGLAAGAVTVLHHRSTAAADAASIPDQTGTAQPRTTKASKAGFDSIGALLGGRPADTTGSPSDTQAAKVALGPVSGLPLPRFVSLKADHVNVRQGPTRDHAVTFIFQRAGLPVEIVAEFENWRRIRDSEGSEGWVMQSMVSGRRTALVSPWSKAASLPIYRQADARSGVSALLQPGVQASIRSCAGGWCRLDGPGFSGWIRDDRLWGAYPGEAVD